MSERKADWQWSNGGGAVAVLFAGYACRCARCGREWRSVCSECPPITGVIGLGTKPAKIKPHTVSCTTPVRCPGCKSVGWAQPAAWTPGEGTSRESVRRRNLARRKTSKRKSR